MRRRWGEGWLNAEELADAPQDRAGWLVPVDARILADWADAYVRQLAPGAAPSPQATAVLERLEKAEPRTALAPFYVGAAALEDAAGVVAGRCTDPGDAG